MKPRQIAITTVTVTATVFAWSVVMVAVDETAAAAALTPALALTVQQIVHTVRSRPAPTGATRLDASADKEDDAP
ncbi:MULTISPECIES: hypothetical protein [unclassified Streptomyces]|uniref:hypothetical protein n=1 Tax=unclassified Streptomyces TaxID=2593676 RepID=UPI000879AC28|nr:MULTISPECIES: hypothetical protein [unclassified Streptomyces]REH18396.1 hypothetical protein BX268_0084 [Streptomyces sp. 2221.1]SDS22693.1 hypothetical protein SAMN05428941_0089 [Streptomyces sp. 2114.2]